MTLLGKPFAFTEMGFSADNLTTTALAQLTAGPSGGSTTIAASGDTTGKTDSANLTAALAGYNAVYLLAGTPYYLQAPLAMSTPGQLLAGTGPATAVGPPIAYGWNGTAWHGKTAPHVKMEGLAQVAVSTSGHEWIVSTGTSRRHRQGEDLGPAAVEGHRVHHQLRPDGPALCQPAASGGHSTGRSALPV